MNGPYVCPVCRYGGLARAPWVAESASDQICPCCGIQFGYDDAAGGNAASRVDVYRRRRAEWLRAGCPWFSKTTPPPTGWDPRKQLQRPALVPAHAFFEALGWYLPSADLVAQLEPGARVKVRAVVLEDDGGADLESARSVWIELTSCSSRGFTGAVVTSTLDADGYRKGDTLEFTSDRVCDVMLPGQGGQPQLNLERAQAAIGKRVLLGLTRETSDGVLEQRQYLATLTAADPKSGLILLLANGKDYNMPPDLTSFDEAPPGEYRLRSTGEVIVDPDYICTWVIDRGSFP